MHSFSSIFPAEMGFHIICYNSHIRDLRKKTIIAFLAWVCLHLVYIQYKDWMPWLAYTDNVLLFSSKWEEEASCVLLQADILEEWVDCRGVSTVPCLRVTVNLTDSNQRTFLHFDEESVLLAPEVEIYGSKIPAFGSYLKALRASGLNLYPTRCGLREEHKSMYYNCRTTQCNRC